MNFNDIKERWATFAKSERGQLVFKRLNRLVTLGVLVFLVYKLTEIGWANVLASLPRNPLFYVLFVLIYLALPLSETVIYRLFWPIGFWEGFLTFLRKRVYNDEVLGYSGEVYLLFWAKKRLNTSTGEAFKPLRDNNIISAMVSTSVAFGLVALLIYTGQLELGALFENLGTVYIVTGLIVASVLAVVVWQFRHHLFSMSFGTACTVTGIHLVRFFAANALMVVQWAIVVPDTPLSVWLTYLAVLIILNRIPFLPSKDLFFMTLGISLSGALDVAEASIAGLLLATSVLTRLTNLTILMVTQRFSEDSTLEEATTGGSVEEG